MNCYYLIGRNTIDEDINEIIEQEREVSKQVIGARDDAIIDNEVDILLRHFDIKQENKTE